MTDERLEQLFGTVIAKIDVLEERVTEMDMRLTAKIEQNTALIVDIEDRLCKRMDKLEKTMNDKYEMLSRDLNGVKLQVDSFYLLQDYRTGNCM